MNGGPSILLTVSENRAFLYSHRGHRQSSECQTYRRSNGGDPDRACRKEHAAAVTPVRLVQTTRKVRQGSQITDQRSGVGKGENWSTEAGD